jgi:hypothetical protein
VTQYLIRRHLSVAARLHSQDCSRATAVKREAEIFAELGAKKARRVVEVLRKRLKAIDPDCGLCKGTGNTPVMELRGPCGEKESALTLQCPCDPEYTRQVLENGRKWAAEPQSS